MDRITPQARNATLVSSLTAVIMMGAGLYVVFNKHTELLVFVIPVLLTSLVALYLSQTGRHTLAGWLMVIVVGVQAILTPLSFSGLGYLIAFAGFSIISSIGLTILPRSTLWRTLILSVVVAALTILVDLTGSPDRLPNPNPESNWIFLGLLILLYSYVIARQFPSLGLRTKVVLGILITGGLSLASLAIFLYFRFSSITGNLSKDLAESVKQSIEINLRAVTNENASIINNQFQTVADDIGQLAIYRASLEDRSEVLNTGFYWDARTKLTQLPGGQFGSLPTDSASVFVPSTIPLTDSIISDLNISSYLDSNAYGILRKNPAVGAVYYLTTTGLTTYYPNIDLASIVAPDFNITTQNFFTVANPENDPEKLPMWTNAYQDPAGIGLILTIAAPVYHNNNFIGVAAADLKLEEIKKIVDKIKIGQTGFSILIDRKGHMIAMPSQGYAMFGVQPESLAPSEETQFTLLGKGPIHLQPIISRAASGLNDLGEITINGVNHYVAYSRIAATNYSLVSIVPTSELSDAIERSQETVSTEFTTTLKYGAVILASLFALAILASLGIGSLIAAPVKQLTQAAEQIAGGDLNVRATYETDDEIGRLANSFNNMTQQIKDLLTDMEQRVADRSADLATASAKNERRASQFQAIAKVVDAISNSRNLDELLPVISRVISDEFGFYHTGIFLLSEDQEFAILAATNSVGGQRMLQRGHRLKVGVLGIVGSVASTKRPLIALDTGTNPTYFNNPDLPETRSEMALPLLTATDIIGILDVQSQEANAFGLEDIEVLTTLARQVSVAIINARLYQETERTLKEAETLSREATHKGWARYTNSQKVMGIRHSGTKAAILRETIRTPEFDEVIRSGTPVKIDSTQADSEAQLIIPVKLRGEIIGALNIRAIGKRKWTEDDIEVASSIIERAAITLENARLLFDSQKRADKERIIGEITSKIGSFISRENILQSTAEEIGRILPGTEIVVQLRKNENGKNEH